MSIKPYLIVDDIDCGHHRNGRAEILSEYRPWLGKAIPATCGRCQVVGPMLYCDGSDGEYGGIALCKPCIDFAFEEALKHPESSLGELKDGFNGE